MFIYVYLEINASFMEKCLHNVLICFKLYSNKVSNYIVSIKPIFFRFTLLGLSALVILTPSIIKNSSYLHVFHISSIVLVPWSSCLGGYSSVPDDYPLVPGCEEHVSSLGFFVA